jgi:ribonucleotide reductase beta subunit family protein with ferritin-like domain
MIPEKISAKEIATEVIREMREGGHALWIDPETHAAQHEFIAEMITERKEREARRKRVEEKIAGSVILSGILFLVGLIGAGFIQWVQTHIKG